jgi:hypothetical protein
VVLCTSQALLTGGFLSHAASVQGIADLLANTPQMRFGPDKELRIDRGAGSERLLF